MTNTTLNTRSTVDEQKKKLEQKKNRLAMEETKLKLKERKARTRHLIEIGGLVTKAGLDTLASNTLYGALLSLTEQLNHNGDIKLQWTKIGKTYFEQEQNITKPVILTFDNQPDKDIRDKIRKLGLRWNRFRSEWYGNIKNIDELKTQLHDLKHDIEILDNIHSTKI